MKKQQHCDIWTFRYKTQWCPIGSFHDWQECIYAHNYQDYRRDPRLGFLTAGGEL